MLGDTGERTIGCVNIVTRNHVKSCSTIEGEPGDEATPLSSLQKCRSPPDIGAAKTFGIKLSPDPALCEVWPLQWKGRWQIFLQKRATNHGICTKIVAVLYNDVITEHAAHSGCPDISTLQKMFAMGMTLHDFEGEGNAVSSGLTHYKWAVLNGV